MIWLLVFSGVFGGLGYIAYKNSKNSTKMYSKLAALALFFLSVFYLYQFVYYTQVGNDIAKFYAGGAGVEYTDNTTGNITYSGNGTTTFSNSNITASFFRLAGDLTSGAVFIFKSFSSLWAR